MTMPTPPTAQMYMAAALHFSDGYMAGRGPGLSPGLEQTSERWNALVKSQVGKPAPSVLAQTRWSPNGQSENSAQRMLPGMGERPMMLPSQNAVSTDTNEDQVKLRLSGVLPMSGN